VFAAAAQPAHGPSSTVASSPGGVLRQLAIASFGSEATVQALAADPFGNLYVTGTAASAAFPVKGAAQPTFAEARVLRTTDRGATWTRLGSPPENPSAIAPDPSDPQVLFASGTSGIFKSTDGAATWRQVYAFGGSFPFNSGRIVIDPGNHLRVAALSPNGNVIIRSLDGGETWTSTGFFARLLLADPTGSGVLLADSSLSRDWGATF